MSALLELLKAKKQDLSAGNRRKTIKPTDGTGRYRILPSWRGADQPFYHDFGQHFIKDGTGKIMAIYACAEKTYGKPCEICDTIRTGTKHATDDFTMNLLKDAGSTGRVLVNVLHLDGPTPTEVQILELAPTAFKSVVDIALEWEEASESIFDEAKGKDILITRTGAGKLTKYSVQVAAKAHPLPAGVMARLHNLDEYVNQESSEQKLRAKNAVLSLTGMPSGHALGYIPTGLPSAAAALGAATIEEDPYAVATPVRRAAPAAVVVENEIIDVPELPVVKPAPVAAVAPKPAPVAAAAESTGDSDLDDLLAKLG